MPILAGAIIFRSKWNGRLPSGCADCSASLKVRQACLSRARRLQILSRCWSHGTQRGDEARHCQESAARTKAWWLTRPAPRTAAFPREWICAVWEPEPFAAFRSTKNNGYEFLSYAVPSPLTETLA